MRKEIIIKSNSKVTVIGSGKEIVSGKEFVVDLVQFKGAYCYYEAQGRLFRTYRCNILEREHAKA